LRRNERTIGTLNGHRLKFDPAAADEGIYIVDANNPGETKVTAIQKNKPGQLVFLVPTLPVQVTSCWIEVRARLGDATSELRTGRLDAMLSRA